MTIKRFDPTIFSKEENKILAATQDLRQPLHDPSSTRVLMIEDNAEFGPVLCRRISPSVSRRAKGWGKFLVA